MEPRAQYIPAIEVDTSSEALQALCNKFVELTTKEVTKVTMTPSFTATRKAGAPYSWAGRVAYMAWSNEECIGTFFPANGEEKAEGKKGVFSIGGKMLWRGTQASAPTHQLTLSDITGETQPKKAPKKASKKTKTSA